MEEHSADRLRGSAASGGGGAADPDAAAAALPPPVAAPVRAATTAAQADTCPQPVGGAASPAYNNTDAPTATVRSSPPAADWAQPTPPWPPSAAPPPPPPAAGCLPTLGAWVVDSYRSLLLPLLCAALVLAGAAADVRHYWRSPARALDGDWLLVAKAFACLTEVCFGFILLPVSRGLVTLCRATWLNRVVDFDKALGFHTWLAVIGMGGAVVHGAAVTISYIREQGGWLWGGVGWLEAGSGVNPYPDCGRTKGPETSHLGITSVRPIK
jgi:hypothetical protein